MTSNIESELKAQVAEFAKSDEALKELIARLAELEGIIDSNQKSRDSLDKSTTSINQLASNLGSFLTLSVDSVGNISKVSTDIGSTIQRIEAEISSAVASNLAEATKDIRLAVSHIQTVAKALGEDVNAIDKKVDEIELSLIKELKLSLIKTWVAVGVSTITLVIIFSLEKFVW